MLYVNSGHCMPCCDLNVVDKERQAECLEAWHLIPVVTPASCMLLANCSFQMSQGPQRSHRAPTWACTAKHQREKLYKMSGSAYLLFIASLTLVKLSVRYDNCLQIKFYHSLQVLLVFLPFILSSFYISSPFHLSCFFLQYFAFLFHVYLYLLPTRDSLDSNTLLTLMPQEMSPLLSDCN